MRRASLLLALAAVATLAVLGALWAGGALRLPWAGRADAAGPLEVVDGDTFDVGGVRVRLFGVDAPERGQTCLDAAGAAWPCGAWATESARAWEGAAAACERLDTDRYGRMVARCRVAGEDLGRTLVRAGAALAYRDYALDYVPDEDRARAAGAGLWAGTFDDPADWRAGRRAGTAPEPVPEPISEAPSAPAPGCAIKGNVSERGRIYHLPGDPAYAATRIDEGKGERWFCSEAEALAAGWRPQAS